MIPLVAHGRDSGKSSAALVEATSRELLISVLLSFMPACNAGADGAGCVLDLGGVSRAQVEGRTVVLREARRGECR